MPYVLKCSTDNEYYGKEINTSGNAEEDERSLDVMESEEARKIYYTIITSIFLVAGVVGMLWIHKKTKA